MQLQLSSYWALRFCFLSISQLLQYSFSSPSLGNGLEAAASSTTPGAKFWYPQLRDKKFDQLSTELNLASASEGPAKESSLFSRFRSKSRPSGRTFFSEVKYSIPSDNFDPENIPENDPIQPFLKKLDPRDEEQISSFIVHQATKKLWDSSDPTTNELNRWLHVLKKAVLSDYSPQPTILISVMYDLKSLQMKFFDKPHFLLRIDHLEELIKATLKYELLSAESLPWGKELFYPSKGFSKELEDFENLKTLVQNDNTLYLALTEIEDMPRYLTAAQIISREFKEYNSYKRVISLAIYYHLIKAKESQPHLQKLLRDLFHQHILFPHEKSLARFIADMNNFAL